MMSAIGAPLRRAALLAATAVTLAATPTARAAEWVPHVVDARAWAAQRQGTVAFAVIDEHGRERGVGLRRHWWSASTLKPILMAAFLRQPSVRSRPLTAGEKALLSPMIRRSADDPASHFATTLGRTRVERLARSAGLGSFSMALPTWGSSMITPLGYARFFRRLPGLIPPRHRAYARTLLETVIPAQRWGVPRAAPSGWTVLLKGGWRAGHGGRIVNQAATLERGGRRITIVVLTDGDPSHDYGTRTIEGVARRLLRGL
jgi:hypothetical protein